MWIGHDLGSPVVSALAALHRKRSRGTTLISSPYLPRAYALVSLLPFVDRKLYPRDQYPDGQFAYYRFYLTNFDQAVTDFDADIPATLSNIYRSGKPETVGNIYRTAETTRNKGWFGPGHQAPKIPPDPALWPASDFDALVGAFRETGFRPGCSWYLNDDANVAYLYSAPEGERLRQPVLFINGEWDGICDISRTSLGQPTREKCPNLTVSNLKGAHWLPLEQKSGTIAAIRSWLNREELG